MRILLLGEFSALHKYLKEGLESLGHEVEYASNGDGFKKIEGSTQKLYEYDKSKYKLYLNRKIQIYKSIKKNIANFEDYDIVQIINPLIYPAPVNYHFLKKIKQKNGLLVMAAAGTDYANVRAYYEGKYRYYPYDYDNTAIKGYSKKTFRGKMTCIADKKAVSLVDIIIPYCWQYGVSYENEPRTTEIISMPVNTDTILYHENRVVDGKIVVLHGLNREKEKGTPIIRKALEALQKKYQDKVEIIIAGHMPLADYQKLMEKANIVIDQCCGGGYGMGIIQAMAMGKVVCADCWPEFLQPLGITPEEFPGIIISNTPESIFEGISYVIEQGEDYILELGKRARLYVEEKHNYIRIAKDFLRVVTK